MINLPAYNLGRRDSILADAGEGQQDEEMKMTNNGEEINRTSTGGKLT